MLAGQPCWFKSAATFCIALSAVPWIKLSTCCRLGKLTIWVKRFLHESWSLLLAWMLGFWWLRLDSRCPSMVSARHRPTAESSIIMVNGKALITLMVCSAFRPPASSKTLASTPCITAQNTFCKGGVLMAPPEANESTTNAAESEEVTKKVTIKHTASNEVMVVSGNCSNSLNKAIALSFCTSVMSWV